MKRFAMRVRHASLTPTEGVMEIEAEDFVEAVKALTTRIPDIEIVELVMEYDMKDVVRA